MSAASLGGIRIPVSGGGYFRLLPYWVTRAGLRQVNEKRGRPFVFYLHPWEIDPGQPRIAVKWLSRFRHYTNLDRCEERLKRLLGDFAFARITDVLERRGLLLAGANESAHSTGSTHATLRAGPIGHRENEGPAGPTTSNLMSAP
jgi:hypothetical protein